MTYIVCPECKDGIGNTHNWMVKSLAHQMAVNRLATFLLKEIYFSVADIGGQQ